MTPQERQLIDDLFARLASAENAPRDPAAMAAMAEGLQHAPNAVYALVQTVLVQDEALKRAHDRIQQLESATAGGSAQPGGFLDSMRDTMFGKTAPHGSVPSVQPPPPPSSRPVWNSGQALQQADAPGRYDQGPANQPYGAPQAPAGGGGSLLGTAAATAAGVIGGGLLMSSIRSMMGGGGHSSAFGDAGGLAGLGGGRSPWGGSDQSGGSLARDAGVNDIGSQHGDRFDQSQFDQAQADADQDQDQDQDDDDEMDMDSDGGSDDGGNGYA